jgi:hypothetical protein
MSAGPSSAATFSTTGAQFGYTLSYPDRNVTSGSGELRDTDADNHCAWLEVRWDKAASSDTTTTHTVCGAGNSAPVSLDQNSAFYIRHVTLKLCRIQNGSLSSCLTQRLDNPHN